MLDVAPSDRSVIHIHSRVAAPAAGPRNRAQQTSSFMTCALVAYIALLAVGWYLLRHLLPSEMTVVVLDHAVTVTSLHDKVTSAALLALLMPSVMLIEAALVGWSASSLRQLLVSPTASLKTDIACFFLTTAHLTRHMGRFLTFGATVISGAWINDRFEALTGLSIVALPAPLPVQVVFYMLVSTFFDYWAHRFDHSRFMWPLHRFHHSAEDFGVITSIRIHPAIFTNIVFFNLPMAILDAPFQAMVYVNLIGIFVGFLIHSKIDSDWGWFGRWIMQSPNNHRMHHKLDMTHPTGHFGRMPIWDRLFGTYYQEGRGEIVVGVDTPYNHGFLVPRDLIRDYCDFWLGLLDGLKSSRKALTPPVVFSSLRRRRQTAADGSLGA